MAIRYNQRDQCRSNLNALGYVLDHSILLVGVSSSNCRMMDTWPCLLTSGNTSPKSTAQIKWARIGHNECREDYGPTIDVGVHGGQVSRFPRERIAGVEKDEHRLGEFLDDRLHHCRI